VIIYEKGWQGTGDLVGNTSLKVKGNAYLFASPHSNSSVEIWDAQDVGIVINFFFFSSKSTKTQPKTTLVYPQKEPDAVFITTNFLTTPFQTRGNCTGNDEKVPLTGGFRSDTCVTQDRSMSLCKV